MNKKQRRFWADDNTYRKLQAKAIELGFIGKGSLSKLLEALATNPFIIIRGSGRFEINTK